MGRWTYYSPLLLGTAVAIALLLSYRGMFAGLAGWQYWLLVFGGGLAAGLVCQLLLVAVQGAFAQVLPVPGGRSVRGREAGLAGWLLLLGLGLGFAAGVLGLEKVGTAALATGTLALAALVAAAVAYVWSWPTAIRDFADDR